MLPGQRPWYKAPDGRRFESRLDCWRDFDRHRARSRIPSSVGTGTSVDDGINMVSPTSDPSPPRLVIRRPQARRAQVAPEPPQPPTPLPGSAAAAVSLDDIIPEAERPSTRRPPTERRR